MRLIRHVHSPERDALYQRELDRREREDLAFVAGVIGVGAIITAYVYTFVWAITL